jgi:hypothetical protein
LRPGLSKAAVEPGVTVRADSSEVRQLVRAAVDDRGHVIDFGGELAALLASVAVTFEDPRADLAPGSD